MRLFGSTGIAFLLIIHTMHADGRVQSGGPDPYAVFEKPGRLIRLHQGNSLSLYCSGSGSPTVVLETGFRGGAYASWFQLQPALSKTHHTCSYDRAGYGFSELGHDLPRDLNHAVADLHELLQASGEKGSYILAGHSNGGYIIGAYADLYPKEVAGLVFLDAAMALEKYPVESSVGPQAVHPNPRLEADLQRLKACQQAAKRQDLAQLVGLHSNCINPKWLDGLPPAMAQAEITNEKKPSYWTALLSESESNYQGQISGQAMALLPHHWEHLPIRVITAAIPDLDDDKTAELFGIPKNDKMALAQARENRHRWESRQAQVCQYSSDCRVQRVPTAMHLVQNADPAVVVQAVEEISLAFVRRPMNRQNSGHGSPTPR